MGKNSFFPQFFPSKNDNLSQFRRNLFKIVPPFPPTFEGVFAEILHRPFGIFNKIDTLFVLSLDIRP